MNRPLEKIYAAIFIDAIRESRSVTGRFVISPDCAAIGVDLEGHNDILRCLAR